MNNIKYSVKFTVDGINDPSLSRSSYLYLYNSIRFPSRVQKLFGLTIFFSDAEQPTSTWKPVRKGEKHLFDPGEPPAARQVGTAWRGSGAGAGTAAPGRAVLPGTQGTWLGAGGSAAAWGWMPVGPCVPPSLGASPGQQAVLQPACSCRWWVPRLRKPTLRGWGEEQSKKAEAPASPAASKHARIANSHRTQACLQSHSRRQAKGYIYLIMYLKCTIQVVIFKVLNEVHRNTVNNCS